MSFEMLNAEIRTSWFQYVSANLWFYITMERSTVVLRKTMENYVQMAIFSSNVKLPEAPEGMASLVSPMAPTIIIGHAALRPMKKPGDR